MEARAPRLGAAGAAPTFQLLTVQKIAQIMTELSIPFTEDDVHHPKPAQLRGIFEAFLEALMGVTKDDLQQPQFAWIDRVEHAELYEECFPEAIFHKTVKTLMETCGVADFSLSDILEPEPKRVKLILSALINFVKFREECLLRIQPSLDAIDQLQEKKRALEARNQDLQAQVRQNRAVRAEQQPQVDELRAREREVTADINDHNVRQAALHADIRRMKEEIAGVAERVAENKYKALNAAQDCARLKMQIVPDPERVKRELAEMAVQLSSDKENLAGHERRARELLSKIDSLTKVEGEVQRTMGSMGEAEVELDRHRAVLKAIESTHDSAQTQQLKLREMAAREQQLKRHLQSLHEKAQRLNKQAEMKRAAADAAADTARKERAAAEGERAAAQAKVDANEAQSLQIAEKMAELHQAHQAEMAALREDYARLHDQLGDYHRALLQSLTDAVS